MYDWQDKIDPASFDGNWEAGFRHYRKEWERLSRVLVDSYDGDGSDISERQAMRQDRNHAAARALGFSHYLIMED